MPSGQHERDPTYAWLMVAVVFTISALAFGTLGSISVFLKPLSTEFGWGRGQTALGYTAISFSSALFGILWGYIADKRGTRWFGVISAVIMAASLYLLSSLTSIIEFYAYYFLFGAFGTAMATTPLYANVGFWFRHNPGLALGVTASGGAIGQALVPYFSGLSISAYGWQQTYQTLASSTSRSHGYRAALPRRRTATLASRANRHIANQARPRNIAPGLYPQ